MTDHGLAAYVRESHSTGCHPAGTCRMGRADSPRAVGPDLRVRGLSGLRIADASVFPAMVSVNIAATCMMIGEKATENDSGVGNKPSRATRTPRSSHVRQPGGRVRFQCAHHP